MNALHAEADEAAGCNPALTQCKSEAMLQFLDPTRVRRLSDVSLRSVKPDPQGMNTVGATPTTRTRYLT